METKRIIPIFGRILVKPIYKEEIIIRPDNAKIQPDEGIVIESSVSEILKGEHIKFKELTGIWMDEYILVNSSDVLLSYGILSRRNHSN